MGDPLKDPLADPLADPLGDLLGDLLGDPLEDIVGDTDEIPLVRQRRRITLASLILRRWRTNEPSEATSKRHQRDTEESSKESKATILDRGH